MRRVNIDKTSLMAASPQNHMVFSSRDLESQGYHYSTNNSAWHFNVSCNAEVLMSERLAFAGSLLQISSFTLGTSTLSQLHGFLYFWRISFLFSTEYSALNSPFTNSARPLAIEGPVSCEQLREELIADNKVALSESPSFISSRTVSSISSISPPPNKL